MNRFIASFGLAVLLSSCSTTMPEPVVKTVTVEIPVPVPCIRDPLVPAPAYPDTPEALQAAPELSDFMKLLDAGGRLKDQRTAYLEGIAAKCSTIPTLEK
jgi:hypothetical protein